MSYTFQFGVLAQYQGEILSGIWLTIKLSILSIVLGSAAGVMLASLRSIKGGAVRYLVDAYVEVIRNTPFLVQLFIVYFGLPGLGIRVGADTAALIGMTINLAAYSTEIIRAGIEAVHKSQIEAGEALGFSRFQIYRHVILVPAVAKVYPALCSQFVLMMLASSICSAISTHELAASAAFVESQTYRSFEVYIVVTLIYLALALALRAALGFIGMWLFGRRVARRTMTALPEVPA
ncbi:amino acid ABC transporter permease [Rhizobium mongolense]|jgi:polar amino acid transport system permease protein|uniref:Polar amino acid transport system permease protein n=2 Tax=Rhizobium mongolense TaxID=57676 RepID=A0A7W6RIN3_9HYPH|nr:amino acid ABC transporter permease [Rhizobium mongolense]MBB4227398.1 polar amino acid transport system permease protein [Rhizobium mongolense]MBB4273208.1 polar amino acid transport system permease protein [Rhizobium mongolense]TVZ74550.1 polar amino acid transport system permease protein [Rhizobium mongolense USDA 1844]